jgi:hypothetical protein
MAGSAMLVGGLASLGGGLAGMFGGGSNQPTPPQPQIPAQPGVSALTGGGPQDISSLSQYNLGGQYMPAYQSALSNYLANPYGSLPIQTAAQFAPGGVSAAGQGLTNAGMIGGDIGPMLNQAFDPQQALYARTAGQVSDAEQAQLAASGLGQTPWGAGAYGQTMSDFNLGWQNQQLQRMISGLGAAGPAAQGAFNLGTAAPSAAVGAAGLPFQTYGNVAQYPMQAYGAASQYGQGAAQVPQTGIGDWIQYLNAATGSQQAANQQYSNMLAAQKQQFTENQAFGQGIGAGLGGIAAARTPTGGSIWNNPWTNPNMVWA